MIQPFLSLLFVGHCYVFDRLGKTTLVVDN